MDYEAPYCLYNGKIGARCVSHAFCFVLGGEPMSVKLTPVTVSDAFSPSSSRKEPVRERGETCVASSGVGEEGPPGEWRGWVDLIRVSVTVTGVALH